MNLPIPLFARAVVAGLASLLMSCPAAADSEAVPPIGIESCTMSEDPALQNPERPGGGRESTVSALTIVYSNDRDLAATDVRFTARYRGKTFSFDDRGSFAPHAKQTRDFTHFNATFAGTSADCRLTSATFSDGSRWDAPADDASPKPSR